MGAAYYFAISLRYRRRLQARLYSQMIQRYRQSVADCVTNRNLGQSGKCCTFWGGPLLARSITELEEMPVPRGISWRVKGLSESAKFMRRSDSEISLSERKSVGGWSGCGLYQNPPFACWGLVLCRLGYATCTGESSRCRAFSWLR